MLGSNKAYSKIKYYTYNCTHGQNMPQGSVLALILLLIYVNYMPDGLYRYKNPFVNDAKIMKENANNDCHRELQEDSDKLFRWSRNWKMKLIDKLNLIILCVTFCHIFIPSSGAQWVTSLSLCDGESAPDAVLQMGESRRTLTIHTHIRWEMRKSTHQERKDLR